MNERDLRKLHRITGIVIAPLLILQALSGIFLSIGWLLELHARAGETIDRNIPPLSKLWDMILVEIHYGLGVGGVFYHVLLGIGVIVVAVSGSMIFLRILARQKKK